MKIKEIIEVLSKIEEKFGNIEVFFDCPFCLKSYTPNRVVTQAAHFHSDLKNV